MIPFPKLWLTGITGSGLHEVLQLLAVAVVADRDSVLQECGAEVLELLPLLAVSFNPRHLFLRTWRCDLPSWEFLVLDGSLVPGHVWTGLGTVWLSGNVPVHVRRPLNPPNPNCSVIQ